MKKILLTGGAGFIGYHVAKELLRRGDRVVIVDNFNDYYDPNLKKDRARHLISVYRNVLVKKIDIRDYEELTALAKQESFDAVMHLAAQAGVRYSIIDPFIYESTNLKGTLNLLEVCRHQGIKDFIFASSSSVYGGNTKMPFAEEDRVNIPISLYAATKKANEEMAYTYHHLYGLNCTGLRFFTVYGPWGRPDMALFKFTKNIIEDKPIDVYNHGNMARDFTYIDDIVMGVISAIDHAYPYEIINLARGESRNLSEYIRAIEQTLGKIAEKRLLPMQPGDVPATSASIVKAQKLLNYRPQVSIGKGVENFVLWFKEYFNY